MQKIIRALLFALLPSISFAISCPNNGTIIQLGDSEQAILSACGMPISRHDFKKVINQNETWTYYRHGIGATNIKIKLSFANDSLVNIKTETNNANNGHTIATNSASSTVCGRIIAAGDKPNLVQAACGLPISRKVIEQTTIDVSELLFGNAAGPDVLVFEDGKLVDWRHGFSPQ
jgi:hypothetical protein